MASMRQGSNAAASPPQRQQRRHFVQSWAVLPLNAWTSYLSAAAVTTLVYARWNGTYLDDDQMAILGYREVVNCTALPQLFDAWDALWTNDFWGVPLRMNVSHKSWRPLTTLTLRAGWCLHGDNPWWFHVVNTCFHVVATLLFQAMCEVLIFHRRVCPRRAHRRSLAWVAGVLYGIHPIHVECVTNIVGRAEPLAAIFFILTVFAFSWGRSLSGLVGLSGGVAASVAALAACFLSLVSKEQGFSAVLICLYLQTTVWTRLVPDVVAPVLLVTAPAADVDHPSPRTLSRVPQRETAAPAAVVRLLALGTGSVAMALWRLARNGGSVTVFSKADNGAAFAEHMSERVMTYAHYHWLQAVPLVWPYRLIHDMSFTTLKNVESCWDWRNGPSFALYAGLLWQGVASLRVVCTGVSVAAVRRTHQLSDGPGPAGAPGGTASARAQEAEFDRYAFHEAMLSGLALLILPFLPASNLLVTVGFTVAERVMYVPSMGFCVIVALLFHSWAHSIVAWSGRRSPSAFRAAAAEPVGAAAEATDVGTACIARSRESATDCGLHERVRPREQVVLRRALNCVLLATLTCFGTRAYMRTADWDSEMRLLDAGIWAYPTNSKLFANLAIAAYAHNQDLERSVKAADWSLALKPDIHTSFSMRGLVFKDLGLFEQAEADLRKAIEIAPLSDMSARTNLGIVKVQQARELLGMDRPQALQARVAGKSPSQLRAASKGFSHAEKVKIEELVTEAARYASANPKVLTAVGEVYLRLGKPSMAAVLLRRSLEFQHDDTVASVVQVLDAQLQ